MASSRLARFVTEVAPPQFVSVMRRRTVKALDTIKEEEREIGTDSMFSSSSFSSKISPFTSSSSSGLTNNHMKGKNLSSFQGKDGGFGSEEGYNLVSAKSKS